MSRIDYISTLLWAWPALLADRWMGLGPQPR